MTAITTPKDEHSEKLARLKLRAAEALNYANEKTNNSKEHLYSPTYEDLTFSSDSVNLDKMTDLVDEYDLIR